MAEHFKSDLLFIIFLLLIAAALGYLIGYLVRKSMKCKKCEELQEEVDALKLLIGKLETNIKKKEEPVEVIESVTAAEIPKVKEEVVDSRPRQDDLKIVLGIGPKISRLLNNRGISTWKQLSEAEPVLISEYLLQDGGERYRIHNPATWPYQAKLADEGRWDELKDYQGKLEI